MNFTITHNLPDNRILLEVYKQSPGLPEGIRKVLPEFYIDDERVDAHVNYQPYRTTYSIIKDKKQQILKKDIVKWIDIEINNYDTYPPEGIDVLVSDGNNYDVAWFIYSSTYQWRKINITEDTATEFKQFEIKKWKLID